MVFDLVQPDGNADDLMRKAAVGFNEMKKRGAGAIGPVAVELHFIVYNLFGFADLTNQVMRMCGQRAYACAVEFLEDAVFDVHDGDDFRRSGLLVPPEYAYGCRRTVFLWKIDVEVTDIQFVHLVIAQDELFAAVQKELSAPVVERHAFAALLAGEEDRTKKNEQELREPC